MLHPVHKVVLPTKSKCKVAIPDGSSLLKSGVQTIEGEPRICVWYISGSGESVEVEFAQLGTGLEVPDGFSYLGTVQFDQNGSELVQHQFFKPQSGIHKLVG